MGMYTELNIAVEFKKNAPADVISALNFMTRENLRDEQFDIPESIANHPLFKTDRWSWMLRSGGSYYFDAQPSLTWRFDDIAQAWFLTVCTNINNYTGEWKTFLDFIAPHLQSHGYIGTYRYEEDAEPTLVYIEGGCKIMRSIYSREQ